VVGLIGSKLQNTFVSRNNIESMPGRRWLSDDDLKSIQKMVKSVSEAKDVIDNIPELKSQPSLSEIEKKLDQLIEENKEIRGIIHKVASTVSKLYKDGEINKATFDKLDEFLKSYYDDENLLKDY